MKKILLAVLLSFVFVSVYTFFSVFVVSFVAGNPMMNSYSVWQTPINLPTYLYYYFAPESLQFFFNSNPGGIALLNFILFLGNVLLYTIPFILIVKIISSIRNKDSLEG